jgi:type I restriction enzyme, S subunit
MTFVPLWWAEAPLSDIGEWRGGTTPTKSNPAYWLHGDVPWVSPKDMKSEVIDDSEDKITTRALEERAARTVPAGSLLVVTRSGILRHSIPVAVTAVEVAINQDIKALVPARGIDPSFIAGQIRWCEPNLLAQTAKAGTTVDSLDFDRLKAFRILIAPAGEQRRISARIDDLRTRVLRARLELDEVPALVMRAREDVADLAAGGALAGAWRDENRKPRSDELALRELVLEPVRTGLSIRGRSEPPGVRALRLGALRSAIVDLADVRYLPIDAERAERFKVRPGDVLISRGSGTRSFTGRAAVVPAVPEPTIFPDTAFRVRLDPERVLPEWFVAIWNAPRTRAKFDDRIRTTAGIWKMALRDILAVRVEVPPIEAQRETVERLRATSARLDRALAKHTRARRLLDQFEKTIYAMAFSGRLVDQDPTEGDAQTLLDNIRSAPRLVRPAKLKVKPTMSNETRFSELLASWPDDGRSFEQLRTLLPAPYDELNIIVFDHLRRGVFRQRFDAENRVMKFLKVAP